VDGYGLLSGPGDSDAQFPESATPEDAVGGITNESWTQPFRYSYLHPLGWDNLAWDQLIRLGSMAGVLACQVHGLGQPNLETPSVRDYEGLVLRARRDLAVVRRQVFWRREPAFTATPPDRTGIDSATPPMLAPTGQTPNEAWSLFSDEPPP
jgi:hypothetical protein